MSTAPDGSPVELYARLPALGEGARIATAVPAGGSILELGCGTGRITRQLVALGHDVVAVDESPEMLALVEDAETVCATIEGLDLGRRFDAALLASNLVNAAEPAQRRAFLETARRHAPLVVIEGLELSWRPSHRETRRGELRTRLRIARIEDGLVHGEVAYELDGHNWRHGFVMRVFADRGELDAALAEAGLRFERWLDDDGDGDGGRWLLARAA